MSIFPKSDKILNKKNNHGNEDDSLFPWSFKLCIKIT